MLAGLTPEDELCLLLARGQLSPDVRARAQELIAGPFACHSNPGRDLSSHGHLAHESTRAERPCHARPWDALLQRAEEHQVLPLIYRSLRTLEFQGVP